MAYQNLLPFKLTSAQSLAADYTSPAISTQLQDNIGIQLNWTGSPTGTFDVQISMDHKQDQQGNITVAGNWISITLNPTISAAGSADNAYIDLNQLSTPYVRIKYTRSSGTGSLDIFTTAKAV